MLFCHFNTSILLYRHTKQLSEYKVVIFFLSHSNQKHAIKHDKSSQCCITLKKQKLISLVSTITDFNTFLLKLFFCSFHIIFNFCYEINVLVVVVVVRFVLDFVYFQRNYKSFTFSSSIRSFLKNLYNKFTRIPF